MKLIKQIAKIGWVLISEGIITSDQLESILSAQAKCPERSLGEIAADLFAVSENQIESAFCAHILTPVVANWFVGELSNKLVGIALDSVLTGIEVKISRFTRNTLIRKEFNRQDGHTPLFRGVPERRSLFRVTCAVDEIVLSTAFDTPITLHNLGVEYDPQRQTVKVDNESIIMEAKIKLSQLYKAHSQPPTVCSTLPPKPPGSMPEQE